MTTTQHRAPSVHADAAESVNELSDLVRQLAGDNARSLTVFGRAVTPHFHKSRDDIRSVFVLEDMELTLLRTLAKHGPQLGKAGLRAPLIMTESYIQSSCDVFPLEFLEIQQGYRVVFGPDSFAELPIRNDDVRLQCEREIKSLLIGLRQGLLAAAGRDSLLTTIETEAGESLIRTLRGLLYLKEDREPGTAAELLSRAERITGKTLNGVRTSIDSGARHGWEEFVPLYKDLEVLGGLIDAWS